MTFTTSSNPVLYAGLLVSCLLLGTGLLVLAWRRPRRRQRALRLLAGALAAASLWLMACPPVRQRPATRSEAIVLTRGYSPDTLRHLLLQLGPGTAVWASDSAEPPRSARALPSLLTLTRQRPALRRVHILGRGPAAADLPQLGPLPIRLHEDADSSGFETAYWPGKITLGEMLVIEGTISAPAPGPAREAGATASPSATSAAPAARATAPAAAASAGSRAGPAAQASRAIGWVVLRAAGAGRDSVRLPAAGGAFRLRYQPKTAGLACFELLLKRAGQPPQREPVPVEVTTSARPAMLLLAATPAFEFKYLKNYLGEAHYPVALRTSVSRGLVQTDFLNQSAQPLDHLTPALLARYQLVVADAATLAALTGSESQALQAAIGAGRLGLVELADAAPLPRATPGRGDFVVRPRPASTIPQPLRWANLAGQARAPLPAQLLPAPALRPLVTGPAGVLLAARRRVGLGFTVVTAVPETFRWGLLGQATIYASYWNQLLMAARPPAPAAATWHPDSRWPRPGQPLLLHLAGAFPAEPPTVAPQVGRPSAPLALRQDSRLSEWSTGQYWPGAAGWYRVQGPQKGSGHFYVYPARAWALPERRARQQAIRNHNQQAHKVNSTFDTANDSVGEPWPVGWFFALFLVATGYLWLEEKL